MNITKIPLVICGIILCIAFIIFIRNGIRFKQIFKNIKKIKKDIFIVCLSGVFGIMCLGVSYLNSFDYSSYTVKYKFEEASEGLNPNGTYLNASDIVGNTVLENTAKDLNIDVDDLKYAFTLTSAIDSNSLNVKNPHIATEYTLATQNKVNGVSSKKLIKTMAKEYQNYFMSHNVESVSPLKVEISDDTELEYTEAADMLEVQAKKIKNFLASYKWENEGYSDEDNQTFSSLVKKTENYINKDIENFKSYITENGIAKNKTENKNTLEYKNKLLQKDYDKNMASYNVCLEAIDLYNSTLTDVVLVPTQDEEGNFYMSRTKIGVDYLATYAKDYSKTASTYLEDLAENDYILDNSKTTSLSSIKSANEMLQTLKDNLTGLSDTTQEFFKKFIEEERDGYLQISFSEQAIKDRLDVKSNIVYIFIFFAALSYITLNRKEESVDNIDK